MSRRWTFKKVHSAVTYRYRRYRRRFFHRPKYFLCIYTIFQNEARFLKEWLDLHMREGIEHFFLVDHGSSDDWLPVVRPYIDRGIVTVKSLGTSAGSNDRLRMEHADFALDATEWLLVQDIDEFTFSVQEKSIAEFLRGLPADVHQVAVPWVLFGTGGNDTQPPHVVPTCTRSEDLRLRATLDDSVRPWTVKSILRPRYLRHMRVHVHDVVGRTVVANSTLDEVRSKFFIPNRLAADDSMLILQNHYVFRSKEFYKIKMARSGYWKEQNRGVKTYTWEVFEREEAVLNAVENRRLFEKHRDYYERESAEIGP